MHNQKEDENEVENAVSQPKAWKEIQANFLPQVVALFKKNSSDMDLLDKMLKAFCGVCEAVPGFLKPQYSELLSMFLEIMNMKSLDFEMRGIACENFLTMAQRKPKFCAKLGLERKAFMSAVEMLLEIEEDEDWKDVDETEEGCETGGENG